MIAAEKIVMDDVAIAPICQAAKSTYLLAWMDSVLIRTYNQPP